MVSWGFTDWQGWALKHLPAHYLCDLHSELQKRKCREINAINHSAAILCDLDQASKEKRQKLEYEKWLPFQLDGDESGVMPERQRTLDLLVELQKAKKIPLWAEVVLVKSKLMKRAKARQQS